MHNESKCEEEKKESFAPKTTGMLFSPKKELQGDPNQNPLFQMALRLN